MKSNAKAVLKKIQEKYDRVLKETRAEMGKIAIAHYKESFDREGFNNVPFMHWKLLKKKRAWPYTKNKILNKTGRLKNSLRYRTYTRVSSIRVDVFTNVPYAAVHNFGLRAGRGKGFKMPKRQFLGYSKVLEKKLEAKFRTKMNFLFK